MIIVSVFSKAQTVSYINTNWSGKDYSQILQKVSSLKFVSCISKSLVVE